MCFPDDKFQFATAGIKALTMKVNLSDAIEGIDIDDDHPDALFCSEYCAECLKRAALNYDFPEESSRGRNTLHPTSTYAMDNIRTAEEGHTEAFGGVATAGDSVGLTPRCASTRALASGSMIPGDDR